MSAVHTLNGANQKSMLPRSPGYFPSDNSLARLEFQDCKRSTDQLKELARTTPPDDMATKPMFIEKKPTADLIRTDSGRRRRLLEQIGGSGGHAQRPLKRLFRLNRSATTSDLSGQSTARGSLDVASKHSSGGRTYLKITIPPKMYKLRNQSTYKVNFEDLNTKGKSHKWIQRRSQPRAGLDLGQGNEGGPISHTSGESVKTVDQGKKVTDLHVGSDIHDPTKAATKLASNGYSPSKGIPKVPEHGLQDFAAATLATAQARARAGSSGYLFQSPERLGPQSRQRESPVRQHGHHIARRRTSSKGPYSVPIKFQLRPQRASLPKTPRTSHDEPKTVEVSPIIAVKGAAAQSPSSSPVSPISPMESSPAKSGRSFIDECQSDAESGQIMNAQRAEFIHGHGAYAYHYPSSTCQPPKPGPAPTRALPSLPEGCNDGATPKSTTGKQSENKDVLPSDSPAGCGSSPKQPQKHAPKSPPKKGHRYRLSPVKNNVPSESRILKPSPTFAEAFPQPPRALLPRRSSEVISLPAPNREVDGKPVVTTCQSVDLSSSTFDPTATPRPAADNDLKLSKRVADPSPPAPEYGNHAFQRSKDADKDNLYIPWHESRVDRVKALKHRDMERHRAHENSPESQQRRDDDDGEHPTSRAQGDRNHQDTKLASPLPPAQRTKNHQPPSSSARLDIASTKGTKGCLGNTKNDFSPIIIIAEEPPCPTIIDNDPLHPYPPFSDTNNYNKPPTTATTVPSTNSHHLQPNYNDDNSNIYLPHNHHLQPNGILDPHHHPSSYSHRPTTPQVPLPSPSPNLHPSLPQLLASETLTTTAHLEARLAAMEKKNLLLERAFMAVIDASAGLTGRGSAWLSDGSGRRERMSGVSEGDGLGGRVDEMLDLVGGLGRGGGGGGDDMG
ncbi:MAG: hypothetical protein LQ339_000277 [Xanthoria mediterranea]|nr:MAG: hypothetical protein LQ339_000277 [Xanthoria mediterranea]